MKIYQYLPSLDPVVDISQGRAVTLTLTDRQVREGHRRIVLFSKSELLLFCLICTASVTCVYFSLSVHSFAYHFNATTPRVSILILTK